MFYRWGSERYSNVPMLTEQVNSLCRILKSRSNCFIFSLLRHKSLLLLNHSQQLKNKFWYSSILKIIPIFDSSFPFSYRLILHFLEELSTHSVYSLAFFSLSSASVVQLEVFLSRSSDTPRKFHRHFFSSHLDASVQLTPPAWVVSLFSFDGLFSTCPVNWSFCNLVLGPLLFLWTRSLSDLILYPGIKYHLCVHDFWIYSSNPDLSSDFLSSMFNYYIVDISF